MYVKKILKNKLILALQLKENRNLTSVNLGQVVHGVVINCVDNESLTMDIVNENVTATLPLAHLNSSFEYSKYLLGKLVKEGITNYFVAYRVYTIANTI